MLPCLLISLNVQLLRLPLGPYEYRAGLHKFIVLHHEQCRCDRLEQDHVHFLIGGAGVGLWLLDIHCVSPGHLIKFPYYETLYHIDSVKST